MSRPKNKLKLLIIEDSEHDSELMVRILRKNNFELDYHLITSAPQMKSHLSENSYDLVISDFNLPGFSGIEALKIAKAHDSMLPFILISGLITREQETEILELGADEVIVKSNMNRLPFAVRRVSYEVEEKRKMKTLISTKDKLISVIAHDLRGTLEGIQILTEHLDDDLKNGSTESLRESLKLIGQSARSTNQLLDNLLHWALLQLGSFKPTVENFDLRTCLQEAIDFNFSKAAGKGIQLEMNESPSVKIEGDCNMLSIVFRNLISNAIKFSNANETILTDIQDHDEQVRVRIRDHGIGIPDDLLHRLFDPDDRPTRAGTSREKSSGLGLLLSNDAVKMHSGKITVLSEVGEGSTFTVHLPKEFKNTCEEEII